MTEETPAPVGDRPRSGWFGRMRDRWHRLDRGWQASALGSLVVLAALLV